MIRQQNNERLRRQFAQKANHVGQWVERHLDMVASVGVQKGKDWLFKKKKKNNDAWNVDNWSFKSYRNAYFSWKSSFFFAKRLEVDKIRSFSDITVYCSNSHTVK